MRALYCYNGPLIEVGHSIEVQYKFDRKGKHDFIASLDQNALKVNICGNTNTKFNITKTPSAFSAHA